MNTFCKSFWIVFLFIGVIGLASFSHAEEYNLSYGARLTEASGAPILGQDGKLDLEVSFYNAGTGGSPIGPSPISFPGTGIAEGIFQLNIALTSTEFHQVFQDPSTPVYIEVRDVKSGAIFPRQRFSVIPFALKTPIDNDTIVYNSEGKLTVGSGVGTVKQVTAGSGLTGGTITDSGTITVDAGTTGNKIVQLSDGKLPSVDGSNLSRGNAEKLQTRNVSAAVPVSGQVLKWSGSAWVPSSDLVGETGSGEANTASNATSGSGVGLFKEKVSADLQFYSLSPGAGVTINLVDDDVVIASTITQYTDAMAKAAAVADSIADSVTTVAPSQNAVFDALATKQASVTTSTDLNLNSITTNAVNAITVNPGVSTGEIKLKELSVNGTNYVGLKAPGSITSDLTLTLPGSTGTNGQFLKTDGSGNLSWADQASVPVSSVNALTGAVTLTTTNIAEGTNLYYTEARAKAAAVGDVITDAITDKAPSQNAVFDALALKSSASHNHSGVYEPAGLSTDVVTTTKILNDAVTSAKIASGVEAAKIGGGGVDNTEFGYLDGVTSAVQTQLNGKVAGPDSAADNTIVRFDGTTGKQVQNSSVVIDDSGNVGIGTTNPSERLDLGTGFIKSKGIKSTASTGLELWSSGTTSSRSFVLDTTSSRTAGLLLDVKNDGVSRFIINDSGNVGIGTSSSTEKLHVRNAGDLSLRLINDGGTSKVTRIKFATGPNENASDIMWQVGTDYNGTNNLNWFVKRQDASSPTLFIDASNNLGVGTAAPAGIFDVGGGKITVQSGGNVGIGTTSPTQKLSVVGTVESTSGGFKFPDGTLQATAIGATYASLYRDTVLSFGSAGGWSDIPFNRELTKSNIAHSNTINPERIQVNVSGVYEIRFAVNVFSNSNAGTAYARLYKNGTDEIPGTYATFAISSGYYSGQIVNHAIVSLNASDYVAVQAGTNNTSFQVSSAIYSGSGLPSPTTNSSASITIIRLN